jgi:hypothetical protein
MSASQTFLSDFEPDLSLTDEERAIYEAVVLGGVGVREYQRWQGWDSPGTASKLLERAHAKVRGDSDG